MQRVNIKVPITSLNGDTDFTSVRGVLVRGIISTMVTEYEVMTVIHATLQPKLCKLPVLTHYRSGLMIAGVKDFHDAIASVIQPDGKWDMQSACIKALHRLVDTKGLRIVLRKLERTTCINTQYTSQF